MPDFYKYEFAQIIKNFTIFYLGKKKAQLLCTLRALNGKYVLKYFMINWEYI